MSARADALVAKAERVADVARANGRVDGDREPAVVLDGTVVAGAVEFVGLYRERGEATSMAYRSAPSLLRDIGGSWVVFRLIGRGGR